MRDYGYVKRALPTPRTGIAVDALERKNCPFDRRALARAKLSLTMFVALSRLSWTLSPRVGDAATWPESRALNPSSAGTRGLQLDADLRKTWPEVLGNLVESEETGQGDDKQKLSEAGSNIRGDILARRLPTSAHWTSSASSGPSRNTRGLRRHLRRATHWMRVSRVAYRRVSVRPLADGARHGSMMGAYGVVRGHVQFARASGAIRGIITTPLFSIRR